MGHGLRALRNPFALDPEPEAPHAKQPDNKKPGWNRPLKMFTVPFFMADTNSPVVRRSQALAGHPWGDDFQYREVMSTPGNARGLVMAGMIVGGLAGLMAAMKRPALRAMLEKRAPQPGEGPDEETRRRGHWKVRFVADDRPFYVAGDEAGDPGYGSTSRMLAETGMALLANDADGGIGTPGSILGEALVERLREHAEITFAVED